MSGEVTRGFRRRRASDPEAARLPPGQYRERGFPVLTAGPTPRVDLGEWRMEIDGLVERPVSWSWDEIHALPASIFDGDIHCVTKWSKLGVTFSGVSVDTLFEAAGLAPTASFALASCYGGYTTNLPLADLTGGKAWVVWNYNGQPLPPEHGGPARLLVPHLYFWKSAKWINRITLLDHDVRGFWEEAGYHDRGDPWLEQRYAGD
ncbi:MAG: sulfite oxidase-like oxidoreductase [Frankia sp.]